MQDTTIIYYTENQLNEPLFTRCQELLKDAAGGLPIISVSHEPIDLGQNICIGKQKRSWLLLYKQLLTGAEAAKTKYVAMAEHDCIYTHEHFTFKPPLDDTFYYNENVILAQWENKNHPEYNGMFSRWPHQRLALSQMICNRDLLVETMNERLALLDKDYKLVREIVFAGEPGLSKLRIEQGQRWAKSGEPVYLKKYLKDQLDKEKYETFKTQIPNLDIRHNNNFTGPRRGNKRTFDHPYWGKLKDLIQ